MDLPCLKWQKHVEEKWNRLDLNLKKCFTNLQEIDDVFEFGLTQTEHGDVDFLRGISKDDYASQKDPEKAACYRERGNISFKEKDYSSAALLYSQGVCNAAVSSEQLSLCYANRSAALFYLHHYQECLADIDRALKHGYPPHLRTKLQTRRTQCLDHLPVGTHHTGACEDHVGDVLSREAKLCTQQGTEPAATLSLGVAVKFCVEKGRHLVATEEIAAGEVVLWDRPYCCVLVSGMEALRGTELDADTRGGAGAGGRRGGGGGTGGGGGGGGGVGGFGMEERRCHFCLGETFNPVPCEGCGYSRYCSDWCRTAAWEEHHRWECPMGAELRATGVMSQLALRVVLKAGLNAVRKAREPITGKGSEIQPITKKSGVPESDSAGTDVTSGSQEVDSSSRYHGDSYLSVYHLLPHLSDHAPSLRFLCAVTVATLYLGLSRAGPPPASWQLGCGPSQSRKCSGQSEEGEMGVVWEPELRLLGSVVLRHVLQLMCNGQAVSTLADTDVTDSAVQPSREVRVATAIFPTLSVLNHSCRPNTSLSFSTGTRAGPSAQRGVGSAPAAGADGTGPLRSCGVTVRAARTIKPGEEVLHCYGPHSSRMVWCERQRLLQEQYHFLCACEACADPNQEWEGSTVGADQSVLQCGKCKEHLTPCVGDSFDGFVCPSPFCGQRVSVSQVNRWLEEVKGYLVDAVALMENNEPDRAQKVLERMSSPSAVLLTDSHPLQGQVADAAARAYATMGDWRKAAWQLERSTVAIATQYGDTSVELGHQLFKLVQLHFNGGSPGPALSVVPRARQLLSLHCGPSSPELLELQAMEDCLQGAL